MRVHIAGGQQGQALTGLYEPVIPLSRMKRFPSKSKQDPHSEGQASAEG
jgi:hypothetical protein